MRAENRLLLSGTPIQNDVVELWSLFDFLMPGFLGTEKEFRRAYGVAASRSAAAKKGGGLTEQGALATGRLHKQVKPFVEDGLHPQTIARGVRKAVGLISKRLAEVAVDMPPDQRRRRLEILAGTALNSKLIANYKDLFAPMVVDAVMALDPALLDLKLVGVKKVPGGSVTDSFAVQGVAFKKTFSYAGFEQMTKSFENCKVLCLNVELELKSEKENAEVPVSYTHLTLPTKA